MSEQIQRKKLLCVDFDGVLHSYMTPWEAPDIIRDPPVPGAMRWLVDMELNPDYQVCIYSSRSRYRPAIMAMKGWITEYIDQACMGDYAHKETIEHLVFLSQKPPAYLTIDDRAICFKGTFPTAKEMDEFKPWFDKYEHQGKNSKHYPRRDKKREVPESETGE